MTLPLPHTTSTLPVFTTRRCDTRLTRNELLIHFRLMIPLVVQRHMTSHRYIEISITIASSRCIPISQVVESMICECQELPHCLHIDMAKWGLIISILRCVLPRSLSIASNKKWKETSQTSIHLQVGQDSSVNNIVHPQEEVLCHIHDHPPCHIHSISRQAPEIGDIVSTKLTMPIKWVHHPHDMMTCTKNHTARCHQHMDTNK